MLSITIINCNYGKCNHYGNCVTYGKCILWKVLHMANDGKCNFGKCIYGKRILANVTEPM